MNAIPLKTILSKQLINSFIWTNKISIISVIGAPVGIASASFTLLFSLATGTVKKLLNIMRKKKEKAW